MLFLYLLLPIFFLGKDISCHERPIIDVSGGGVSYPSLRGRSGVTFELMSPPIGEVVSKQSIKAGYMQSR